MSLSVSHVVRLNENLGPDNRLVARRFFLHLRDFFEALQRSVEHEPVVVTRLTTQMNLLNGLARTTAQVGRTYTMPKLKMVGVSFHGCLGGDGKRRFLDHVAGICTRLNYCPVHRAVFVRTLLPSMWLVKQYEEKIFWGLAFALENTHPTLTGPPDRDFELFFLSTATMMTAVSSFVRPFPPSAPLLRYLLDQ